jgi:starch synthase
MIPDLVPGVFEEQQSKLAASDTKKIKVVALLHWGHVIEDYLDTIGVGLDAFCNEMNGGWMFGYVEALRCANIETVLFCISRREKQTQHLVHRPTGARVVVLAVPQWYARLHGKMINPYGRTTVQTFGKTKWKRLALPALAAVREMSAYLATPARHLAAEIRHEHCDAILCQEYEFPRFDMAVLLGRSMHVPVFATFQGGSYQRWRLERWTRPWAIRAAAGLIIPSAAEISRVRLAYHFPKKKIARIFNPLDLRDWFPVDRLQARAAIGMPSSARVAVWHGRVEMQQKGLDQLIRIWQRVCTSRPNRDFCLLLVGSGRHAAELQAEIHRSGARGVHWVNEYVHDSTRLRQYLCAGDVYVFPSRHEGFPVAPLEAMACSLPVIAADASGIVDIFENGIAHGGIVIPRGDPSNHDNRFVERFADILTEFLEDEGRSREAGRCALQRAQSTFSLPSVGQQLGTFLQESARLARLESSALQNDFREVT